MYMCKTTRVSIFKHRRDNPLSYYGTLIQFTLCIIYVYVPGVQVVMGSGSADYKPWVVLFFLGVAIIVFNEWRKYRIRNFFHERLSKELCW